MRRANSRERLRMRLVMIAALCAAVAVTVIALTYTPPPSVAARENPVTAPSSDAAAASVMLDEITVRDADGWPDYDRDLFGDGWLDPDRNGCDTRNDVLARDLARVSLREDGCVVLSGVLTDPYDGHVESFTRGEQTSPLVQIDHLVALAWAWRQGAFAWTDAQRELFANDPANLVATADENNQSKSDAGPSEWLPAASTCGYVIAFVSVVHTYDLTLGTADADVAREVLAGC